MKNIGNDRYTFVFTTVFSYKISNKNSYVFTLNNLSWKKSILSSENFRVTSHINNEIPILREKKLVFICFVVCFIFYNDKVVNKFCLMLNKNLLNSWFALFIFLYFFLFFSVHASCKSHTQQTTSLFKLLVLLLQVPIRDGAHAWLLLSLLSAPAFKRSWNLLVQKFIYVFIFW